MTSEEAYKFAMTEQNIEEYIEQCIEAVKDEIETFRYRLGRLYIAELAKDNLVDVSMHQRVERDIDSLLREIGSDGCWTFNLE